MSGHHVTRIDWQSATLRAGYETSASGYVCQPLVDAAGGSVHMGVTACQLDPDGHVAEHVHSFEEGFFLLDGTTRLRMLGATVELRGRPLWADPGWCAHAGPAVGRRPGGSRWPRHSPGRQVPLPGLSLSLSLSLSLLPLLSLSLSLPRGRRRRRRSSFRGGHSRSPNAPPAFRLGDADMDVEALRHSGSRVDAPTVSASMATALLVYSGIAVKMLVDQRLDAQLSTMFMVEYQPGGVATRTTTPWRRATSSSRGRSRRSPTGPSTPCGRETCSGRVSAASTPSRTAPTRPFAGSKRSRLSHPHATRIGSTATGSTWNSAACPA